MVTFVASAFSDRATRSDRTSDAKYSTEPAQYRRPGGAPRPRVAYIQPDGDEAQLKARAPGDDPDRYPVTHRWPESRPNMYETDWTPHRRRNRRHRPAHTMSILIAISAVTAAVGTAVAISNAKQPTTTPVAIDAALQPRSSTPQAATRRGTRVSPAPVAPSSKAARLPSTSPTPRPPQPVTGLNQTQMNNAAVIVQVAQERGLPRRAMLVAMMTGMQESSLRNLANPSVPASLNRPNEGSGDNFDSIGIFQQRPSQGWGTVAQLMNPRYAADAFYKRLLKVSDWESKSLGATAQAVQRSALPDAYAEHEKRAIQIIEALL